MSTAVDFASLALRQGPRVSLASGVVSESGSGTDYTGWAAVSVVYCEAQCQLRHGNRGFARLVLTIEGSDDGNSWSTLQTFTFGAGGSGAAQTATISVSHDHMRASWATTGGGEWWIDHVDVVPASINVSGGGASPFNLRGPFACAFNSTDISGNGFELDDLTAGDIVLDAYFIATAEWTDEGTSVCSFYVVVGDSPATGFTVADYTDAQTSGAAAAPGEPQVSAKKRAAGPLTGSPIVAVQAYPGNGSFTAGTANVYVLTYTP